jgi:hypothetical protein
MTLLSTCGVLQSMKLLCVVPEKIKVSYFEKHHEYFVKHPSSIGLLKTTTSPFFLLYVESNTDAGLKISDLVE